jgi:hypothetical protein
VQPEVRELTPSLSALLCRDAAASRSSPDHSHVAEISKPLEWRCFSPNQSASFAQFGLSIKESPLPDETEDWLLVAEAQAEMELQKRNLQEVLCIFDSSSGSFWDVLETRPYCRACEMVVRKLKACTSGHLRAQRDILLLSLDLIQRMAYTWVEVIGWCDEAAFAMCKLGLVHECYDLIVWWQMQRPADNLVTDFYQRDKYKFGDRPLIFKSPAAPSASIVQDTPLEQIVVLALVLVQQLQRHWLQQGIRAIMLGCHDPASPVSIVGPNEGVLATIFTFLLPSAHRAGTIAQLDSFCCSSEEIGARLESMMDAGESQCVYCTRMPRTDSNTFAPGERHNERIWKAIVNPSPLLSQEEPEVGYPLPSNPQSAMRVMFIV